MTTHEMMALGTAMLFAIVGAEWGMRLGCFFAILFGLLGIVVGFVVGFVWMDGLDKLSQFSERVKQPWLRVALILCAIVVMMGIYVGLFFFLGYPMRRRHHSQTGATNGLLLLGVERVYHAI